MTNVEGYWIWGGHFLLFRIRIIDSEGFERMITASI